MRPPSTLSEVACGHDIPGLWHDGGKLDNIPLIGIKERQHPGVLIKRHKLPTIKETIQHQSILINIPTTGFLDIIGVPVIDLIPINKVIETELHIASSIESETLWGDDEEVVVVYLLGLMVEGGAVDWVDVPFVVEGLFGDGGEGGGWGGRDGAEGGGDGGVE